MSSKVNLRAVPSKRRTWHWNSLLCVRQVSHRQKTFATSLTSITSCRHPHNLSSHTSLTIPTGSFLSDRLIWRSLRVLCRSNPRSSSTAFTCWVIPRLWFTVHPNTTSASASSVHRRRWTWATITVVECYLNWHKEQFWGSLHSRVELSKV